MTKRRIIAIGCVLFALSLVSVLFALHRRDPVFEARRLSDWVVSIGLKARGLDLRGSEMPPEPGITRAPSDAKAREAISELGPNALPMLVTLLGAGSGRFEALLRQAANKHAFLQRFVRPGKTVAAQQFGAVGAFYILGSRATPALPDITPMLSDPERALMAMFAVMYINPKNEQDVLSLTNVLSIRTAPPGQSIALLHSTAILILGRFGERARDAVPLLTGFLSSSDHKTRASAAVALARIGTPSERAIDLMIADLPSPDAEVPNFSNRSAVEAISALMSSEHTVWALGECGERARSALPVLTNLQRHFSHDLRKRAEASASRIRGETNHVVAQ